MEILEEFGVQPILLIAQGVNFLILLFILKRFLYKPILKVLEDRKEKIAQSLKNADEIEAKLEKTTLEREERLKKASKEAENILEEATKTADRIISEAHQKAEADIVKMMEKNTNALKQERLKMQQEIKEGLADLVSLGIAKVAGKVLTGRDQKELVEKSIKGMA